MCTGKPVIYSGRGEAVKIIEDKKCGIVVSPEDPEELTKAIERLILKPETAINIGKKGQYFVRNHRLRSKSLEKFEELLNHLIGSS